MKTAKSVGKLLTICLVFSFFLSAASMAQAQDAETKEYAILIVGDEGDAEMIRREKVLISEMAKRIPKQAAEQRLPIYSYHFNKERERAYCENKLNVLNEDLLFVGIVTLQNKVPLKVVYRIDRISNPSRAAKDVLVRAEELQAENAPEDPVEATPSPSPSGTASPAVKPPVADPNGAQPVDSDQSGYRIQLGAFIQLKYAQDRHGEAERAGVEVEILEGRGPDGDVLYRVVTPAQKAKEDAQRLLEEVKEAGFEQAILIEPAE